MLYVTWKILPKHASQIQEIEEKGGKTTRPESDGNKTDKIPCKDLIFGIAAYEIIGRITSIKKCCFLVIALNPVNNTTVHENWSKENTTDTTTIVDSKCI